MLMSDIMVISELIKEHFMSPFLLIHANPRYMDDHGKRNQDYLISLLKSCDHKIYVEDVEFNCHHHFHISKPEETSKIVLKFLNRTDLNNLSSKL